MDNDNPGCGFDIAGLPQCGDLLGGQSRTAPTSPLTPPAADFPPRAGIYYTRNAAARVALNERNTIDINEGDSLSLDASASVAANNAPLTYLWKQRSGPTLLAKPNRKAAITLKVSDDWVSADALREAAVIVLELRERYKLDSFTPVSITVNVIKSNSDGVVAVNWESNTVLYVSELSDADGGPFTDITYQW